jgi:isoleucyl-tRNA synthetase
MLKATRPLRATDWSSTLNLPRSSLPARPLLSKRPAYIKQCSDDLYAWQAVHRPASDTFVLHDGPPYANGSLHTGHALNKILKDIFCRFQLSRGKRVHYVPGWDCHGLPIEMKALQAAMGDKGAADGTAHTKMSPVDIRKAARELASRTIEEQKKNFREWAIMGDWDNAWQTMQKDFELKQLRVFKEMVDKGKVGSSLIGSMVNLS